MPYLGLSEGVGGVTWGWLTVGGDALADKLFTATLTPMPRTFYPHQLLTLFSTPTFFVATIPFPRFCTANPPQICPASAIVVHCHSAIVPECHSAGTSTESHGKLHRPTLYTTEEDKIETHHRNSPSRLTILTFCQIKLGRGARNRCSQNAGIAYIRLTPPHPLIQAS